MTAMPFICGICHRAVISEELDDGSTRWSCPCGKTHGWRGAKGELELGFLRKEDDRGNDLAMFHETFEGLIQTEMTHSEGDTIRLLDETS